MITKVMTYLDAMDYDTKQDFVQMLIEVTEGKVRGLVVF
jgi:hypothetical protein